jgi:DNA polymerase elongation subunit (family B)
MDEKLPNTVFFDLETIKLSEHFEDKWGEPIPHWSKAGKTLAHTNTLKMGFGIACTRDNHTAKLWNDPVELLMYLISDEVDAIVTFNGEAFDFNVLISSIETEGFDSNSKQFSESYKEVYSKLESKSVDVLVHIDKTIGHRISLEAIKIAMEDKPKISSGTKFWGLFNSSNIEERVLATNYILQDVYFLMKVYAIVHEFGFIVYRDSLGVTRQFEMKLPNLEDLKKH